MTFVAQLALPILLAITLPPVDSGGGVLFSWGRTLGDLEVYRFFGQVVLDGGDLIAERTSGGLAFTYPPFAGLLSVGLFLAPQPLLAIVWTVVGALSLLAVLYRCGLRGWTLSLVTGAALVVCEPVRSTLTFGQINLFLMALVVLDLCPGPSVLPKRLLPKGLLTGLAAALKLTPALFVIYLGIARQRMAVLWGCLAFAGCGLIGVVVLPSASVEYVLGLLAGDTRNGGVHYIMNQSVLAATSRVAGGGDWQRFTGLGISAVVAIVGAYAAARWYRHGKPVFALSLCGLATLLASPISWNHHWVWVVPLAVALTDRELSYGIRAIGWSLVGWLSVAPYKVAAPSMNDVELQWNVWQQLVGAVTPILGVAVVVYAAVAGTASTDPTHPTGRNRLTGQAFARAPRGSNANAPR